MATTIIDQLINGATVIPKAVLVVPNNLLRTAYTGLPGVALITGGFYIYHLAKCIYHPGDGIEGGLFPVSRW